MTGYSIKSNAQQEWKYKTQDGTSYVKFVSTGDSYQVYTAPGGGTWVSSTLLHADNTNAKYKIKSGRNQREYYITFSKDYEGKEYLVMEDVITKQK